MSQFAFLKPEFPAVHDLAAKAESVALSDPRAASFYARLALETAVKWMYERDKALRSPYESDLAALIFEPTFRKIVGDALVTKAKLIKDYGNRAVHDTRPVTPQTAAIALRELFHFAYWLARTYAKGAKPEASLQFSADALPRLAHVEATTLQRLQEVAKRFAEQAKERQELEATRAKTEAERAELDAELARLRAEIAEIKKANAATPDAHDYNEAQTRDAFIDLLLNEAGWALDQTRDREFPLTGMPNETGDGFVDYVLWGDDGKPLGLVEAKRTRKDARIGQQQAKLYADCLEATCGQRPIIFNTNGYEHWLWDDAFYPPRAVQGFLKKDELLLMQQRRASRRKLSSVETDTKIVVRFYQLRAIRRVSEAFEKDHQRKALLVMATGSGKTRTVIALVDQLMRANWVKRALFLADRVALVNQAVRAFKEHIPHAAPVNFLTDKATEGRVYVSTYPTMMGLIDEVQNGVRRFGPGHFDLVIIDEAHRSVYRKYKAIFDYFDSLLVGLTATPRNEIDRDTYSLFQLERGVPTDSYDLSDAVDDGFLAPPRAVSVPLRFQREGIRYDDLSEEEKERWDALEWSEDGEVPDSVDAAAVNKWLFNTDTVDKVLRHLMTHGLKVEEGDRLGKTIIFAKNSAHAHFIAERFDQNYPHLKGHFARVIDYSIPYAQTLIDDFSNPERAPHIAISVDMLDTGIDVPEVVNLVFFKIVRSKTKFWQMIGRGTRLRPHLFGPGRHKEHFLVFDFCQNFEFFNQNPNVVDGALGESLGAKLFKARVELLAELGKTEGDEALGELSSALRGRLFDEVAGMSLDNFIVRPQRRYVEKFQNPDVWGRLGLDEQAELTGRVAGLPSAYEDDDLAAKQFDHLVLTMQLALLNADRAFASRRSRIMSVAGQLEELRNVPMVAAEMELILEVQTDEFWQDVTLPMLENVRRRLRKLVKLIEPKERRIVYTDFVDEMGAGEDVALPQVGPGTDRARFLMKVRHFLTQHQDNIAIAKLKRNEQLTPQDLSALESMFVAEGVGGPDDLEQIRNEGGLGLFVRSLIGLDREAAKKALDGFVGGRTLTANQIEFVSLVVDYLTDRGVMDPRRLYESPFTDLDDQGVSGLFAPAEVKSLVATLAEIRARAAA
ncbi:MAG: DEAD/DEAH box helicase family protein [Methylocystis sp.]